MPNQDNSKSEFLARVDERLNALGNVVEEQSRQTRENLKAQSREMRDSLKTQSSEYDRRLEEMGKLIVSGFDTAHKRMDAHRARNDDQDVAIKEVDKHADQLDRRQNWFMGGLGVIAFVLVLAANWLKGKF